jgi:hypothetical protein
LIEKSKNGLGIRRNPSENRVLQEALTPNLNLF